jgi:RES domain-containing protein
LRATPRPPRPKALLDAIEAEPASRFAGSVWRVVTEGFDPLRASRAGGRWDDGSFDVLYTSTERDGALAEAWFHAARGQPIIPSRIRKRIFEIEAALDRVLDLSAEGKLAALGVNMARFGQLSYVQRAAEYPSLQQVAEVAFFYDYEAIIVPNARWPASNVVVFMEQVRPSQISVVASEAVDLMAWHEAARGPST